MANIEKQSAAEIANVSVASVNVFSAGEVQVDPAVVKELREAYENDPFYSKNIRRSWGAIHEECRRLVVRRRGTPMRSKRAFAYGVDA
jgi:hypothetical protein